MAYKFQIGDANLVGALVQEGNLTAVGVGEFDSLKIADDGAIGTASDTDMIILDPGADITIASNLDLIVGEGKLVLGASAVTSTAAELNLLDGVSGLVQADFTKLAAVDSSAAELNLLDAVARGSIIYGNASGASALLAKGAASTFLQSNGSDIAYVAMSGDATLSAGAITIADNAVSLAKMAGIARGSIISGDASGDPAALAVGSAHQFLQSNGTDLAYVSMSGDATLAAGVLSIGATKVTDAMLNDDAATGLAGDGLAAASGVLSVGVDGSSIEINTDALRVKALGITNAMLAGSIVNAKLSNSAVTITAGDGLKTGGSVSLGGSVTLDIDASDFAGTGIDADGSENLNIAPAQTSITSIINASMGKIGTDAAQEYIKFDTANEINTYINNGEVFSVTAAGVDITGAATVSSNLTVTGNLTVNGDQFKVDGETVVYDDTLIEMGTVGKAAPSGATTKDLGLLLHRHNGSAASLNFMGWDESAEKFIFRTGVAETSGVLSSLGSAAALAVGDMEVGALLKMPDNTSGKFLVADGTSFQEVAMSGDAAIASNGALTIADDAITGAKIALFDDSLAATDTHFMIADGTDYSSFALSGDVTCNNAGVVTIAANAVEGSMLNNNAISGQDALVTDLADADELMVSDSGVLKKMDMIAVRSYIGSGTSDVASKAAGDTLIVGVNYFADMGSDGEDVVTLPSVSNVVAGQSVRVKAPSDCSPARTIKISITAFSGDTIDGQGFIELESPYAAVELVAVAANLWRVF
jgi:hypothetical protein